MNWMCPRCHLTIPYFTDHTRTLNPCFSSKINCAPYKPVRLMCGLGSALCFVAEFQNQYQCYCCTNELRLHYSELYTVTRCSLKTVESYSSVRHIYERERSKQFIDNAPYNPVRLVVRKIRHMPGKIVGLAKY